MKIWCFGILLLMTSAMAHAQNWKPVGFIEPVQARVYVDMDSVVDRDKFHTATMKTEDSKSVDTYKALCNDPKSDLALQFPGDYAISIQKPMVWSKSGQNYSMSVKTLAGLFNAACKKPWEIWK